MKSMTEEKTTVGRITEETAELFKESCCDGGAGAYDNSAQPCGCDRGARWVCTVHRNTTTSVLPPSVQNLTRPTNPKQEIYIQDTELTANSASQILAGAEVRIIDPESGGQKGSKLARFGLIPSEFLWALAEHYGKGALKYDDRNWEKGYKWSLSLDALQRHLHGWLLGEDNDAETGTNHMIAVAWHACALFIYQVRGLGTDDVRKPARRPPHDSTT